MYSGFGVMVSKARGADDEINTVLAGTATGLLYKSSGNVDIHALCTLCLGIYLMFLMK